MLSKRLLLGIFILSLATLSPALQFGQPGSPPATQQRGSTPPTFPSDSHPSSTMPPDTSAPAPVESSSAKVEEQIRTAIQRDSRLQRDNIVVSVGDNRVLLSGEVSDSENRMVALRIAGDYAGTRRVVDDLRVQEVR